MTPSANNSATNSTMVDVRMISVSFKRLIPSVADKTSGDGYRGLSEDNVV